MIEPDGTVRLNSTNKVPTSVRAQLAVCAGLPPEKIIVEQAYIGGDFGAKGLSVDEFPCYFLAKATGRPVKFVIKDRSDYEFAREVARRHDLAPRCAAVLMSPVHGELDARTLSEWMLADGLPARLQLQLHKFIWSPSTRGV